MGQYGKVNYLRQLAARMSLGDVPLGSEVVGYVRSSGTRTTDSDEIKDNFYTSVASAFAACTASRNQVIFVLPGHDEAVGTTLLDNLVAGVYVVGVGDPQASDAPQFTWGATGSNWALDVANVKFFNLKLKADANDVTKAITVTAAGCAFVNCRIEVGVASSKDFAICFSIEAGGDRFSLIDCTATGATGTSQVLNQSGVVDELTIVGCDFYGVTAAAGTGVVAIAGATTNTATNLLVAENLFRQDTASGTAALTFTDIAHTGFVLDNRFGTVVDGTPPAGCGITLAGTTNILVHFAENYGSDGKKGSSGILCPAVTS